MAEKGNWQSQNMKKSGVVAGPSSMNPKIAGNSFHCNNSKVSKPTVRNYADGGMVESEAADKATGMKASAGEDVGFFKRLSMGNIDDSSSEAYNRFGAGRAKADRDMESEAAAMKMVDSSRAASPAKAEAADMGDFIEAGSGVVNDTKPDAPAPVKVAAKPAVRKAPVMAAKTSSPAKTAAKPSSASLSQRMGKEYADLERAAQAAVQMPQASAESKARVRKMADDARKAYEAAADAEKTGRSVVLKR